jgi:hypothetical protein
VPALASAAVPFYPRVQQQAHLEGEVLPVSHTDGQEVAVGTVFARSFVKLPGEDVRTDKPDRRIRRDHSAFTLAKKVTVALPSQQLKAPNRESGSCRTLVVLTGTFRLFENVAFFT